MANRVIERGRRVLKGVYGLLPKANIAVIWGWPDYEDSVVALEHELQRSTIRRVILLLTDRKSAPPVELGPKTRRVTKDSPLGFLVFLIARYVFFTHRCFMRSFPPNVVSVNVWHGMPIKRIGCMLDESDRAIASSHTIATSPLWADIMDRSLRPTERVIVSGLPRNDRLFSDAGAAWRAVGAASGDGQPRQLVVWLPTYRESVRGMIRVDGHPTDSVFGMDGVDPDRVNELLATHDAVGLVKPHPMAAFDGEQHLSHLRIVDEGWLRRSSLTLYQLLSATDVLVSDISSVLVDYLLLDRPVIHAMADADAYQSSRGFSLHPIDDYFMGPVATTFDEVRDCLSQALAGQDTHAEQRRRVSALFHSHTGPGSSRRLLSELGVVDPRGT